mgnify:CR=1 FL=1
MEWKFHHMRNANIIFLYQTFLLFNYLVAKRIIHVFFVMMNWRNMQQKNGVSTSKNQKPCIVANAKVFFRSKII